MLQPRDANTATVAENALRSTIRRKGQKGATNDSLADMSIRP